MSSVAGPVPVQQVASSPISNLGKVGDVPTAPGITYFPEASGYRHYAAMLFGIAGFFTLLGVVMMITVGGPSWLFLLAVPVFLLWGWNRRNRETHMDCLCDSTGITVRITKGVTPQDPVYIPWDKITKTSCGNIEQTLIDVNSDYQTTKDYLTFFVVAPGQGSLRIAEQRLQNLAGLIALTNENTRHLHYYWLPTKQAKNLDVLQKTGKYCKVAR